MGIYNLECFQFLMRSFAIGIKETSLVYMEKQLRDLAEKVPLQSICFHLCILYHVGPMREAEGGYKRVC